MTVDKKNKKSISVDSFLKRFDYLVEYSNLSREEKDSIQSFPSFDTAEELVRLWLDPAVAEKQRERLEKIMFSSEWRINSGKNRGGNFIFFAFNKILHEIESLSPEEIEKQLLGFYPFILKRFGRFSELFQQDILSFNNGKSTIVKITEKLVEHRESNKERLLNQLKMYYDSVLEYTMEQPLKRFINFIISDNEKQPLFFIPEKFEETKKEEELFLKNLLVAVVSKSTFVENKEISLISEKERVDIFDELCFAINEANNYNSLFLNNKKELFAFNDILFSDIELLLNSCRSEEDKKQFLNRLLMLGKRLIATCFLPDKYNIYRTVKKEELNTCAVEKYLGLLKKEKQTDFFNELQNMLKHLEISNRAERLTNGRYIIPGHRLLAPFFNFFKNVKNPEEISFNIGFLAELIREKTFLEEAKKSPKFNSVFKKRNKQLEEAINDFSKGIKDLRILNKMGYKNFTLSKKIFFSEKGTEILCKRLFEHGSSEDLIRATFAFSIVVPELVEETMNCFLGRVTNDLKNIENVPVSSFYNQNPVKPGAFALIFFSDHISKDKQIDLATVLMSAISNIKTRILTDKETSQRKDFATTKQDSLNLFNTLILNILGTAGELCSEARDILVREIRKINKPFENDSLIVDILKRYPVKPSPKRDQTENMSSFFNIFQKTERQMLELLNDNILRSLDQIDQAPDLIRFCSGRVVTKTEEDRFSQEKNFGEKLPVNFPTDSLDDWINSLSFVDIQKSIEIIDILDSTLKRSKNQLLNIPEIKVLKWRDQILSGVVKNSKPTDIAKLFKTSKEISRKLRIAELCVEYKKDFAFVMEFENILVKNLENIFLVFLMSINKNYDKKLKEQTIRVFSPFAHRLFSKFLDLTNSESGKTLINSTEYSFDFIEFINTIEQFSEDKNSNMSFLKKSNYSGILLKKMLSCLKSSSSPEESRLYTEAFLDFLSKSGRKLLDAKNTGKSTSVLDSESALQDELFRLIGLNIHINQPEADTLLPDFTNIF